MPTYTGERVVTSEGGFNPTWQRHVAAYERIEPHLGPGRVLDVGCGVGHSYDRLGGRETVGVDLDAGALEGQARETHVADMRELPFAGRSFPNVVAVHSIEHVPDAGRALAEIARVLTDAGTAVLVTPNRLTFARPDEIIDPYHFVEYDPRQLAAACAPHFGEVEVLGLHGSERYLEIVARQHEVLAAVLARDPLRLRRLVPRAVMKRLYDRRLSSERAAPRPEELAIEASDFTLSAERLDEALDVVAVLRAPRRA